MPKPLITIVESDYFVRRAAKTLTEAELNGLRNALAENPKAGDLIPAGQGLRKIRVAARGQGKRGGARVIYYFHGENVPVFLLDVFAKNDASDLSKDQLKELGGIAKAIAEAARPKR